MSQTAICISSDIEKAEKLHNYLMRGIFLQQMDETRNESWVGEDELTSLTVLDRMPVAVLILL